MHRLRGYPVSVFTVASIANGNPYPFALVGSLQTSDQNRTDAGYPQQKGRKSMTDYLHVWEIMKDPGNDGDRRVYIVRPRTNRDTEPMRQVVYDGKLKNVPPRVALERVLETGYSVTQDCPEIILYADSTEEEQEQFRQELIEAAAADPEIARKIRNYLSVSEYGRQQMEFQALLDCLES